MNWINTLEGEKDQRPGSYLSLPHHPLLLSPSGLCTRNLRRPCLYAWKSHCPYPSLPLRAHSSPAPLQSLPRPPKEELGPACPKWTSKLHCLNYSGAETEGWRQATLLLDPQGQAQSLAHSSGHT